MTYTTLMVQLELERANDARLHIAGDLADRFKAKLIGIAACDCSPGPYYTQGTFAQSFLEKDRAAIAERMAETETRFRAAVQGRAREIEWRSALTAPTEYVAKEARAADIVITGSNRDGALLDPFRRVDPSGLVMRAGRPVLYVPPEAEWLKLDRILVAWKDTREARRAILDALPLLQKAVEVNVVEIIEDGSTPAAVKTRVDDVVTWLGGHNIKARGSAPAAVEDASAQIETIASTIQADLIVAGAYGHTRFSEWAFGGVTRDLLTKSTRCSVLSH